ncbi:MAG: hypothetical protein QMD25_02975 [Caldisericia bacterium]|jgi:hypothetical protein|nr:hypothetical protein [Caldisericia bacterium]
MSFDEFEEILKNLSSVDLLSKEEKERIFKYILKKERNKNIILISLMLVISFLLILLIPSKLNVFDPVYILSENESIKNLELNFELYLSNPIFLLQIFYTLLIIFTLTIIFVFIKIKFFFRGGNGE